MAAEGRRYQVQHVLGRGGFGTVYQAEMISGGGFAKAVALKVLNQEMGGMAEVAQRLRDEARLLGRLKHPAILRVDDLVRLAGSWTVVMELLNGANLQQIVHRSGPVPLGIALEIIHTVAGALHAAHDRPGPGGEPLRVLHRDIKPSNIQLTPLGEVKVLDFGVARASFATREAATRSLIFGSVGYMAPERMAGRDSHAGDVYALGVVLYEILSGRRLGTACSRASLQAALVDEALGELSLVHDQPELHALLRSVLAFEPEERPRADAFQRSARRLRAAHPEPWLGDWAESVLPPIMAAHDRADGALSGLVLREGDAEHDLERMETAETDHGEPTPPKAGFTPLPFEPSEPHTPTAGQPRAGLDEIPGGPLGMPELPAPRRRGAPAPRPLDPSAATAHGDEPTPPPAPVPVLTATEGPASATEERAPAAASSPPQDSATPGVNSEATLFERQPLPEATPAPAPAPLEEAGTVAAPHPAAPPATGRHPRRWLIGIGAGSLAIAGLIGTLALGALWGTGQEPPPDASPPEEAEAHSPSEEAELVAPEPEAPAAAVPATVQPQAQPAISAPAVPDREPPSLEPPPPAAEPAPTPSQPSASPRGHQPSSSPAPVVAASVALVGDATAVELRGEGGSFGPGELPPGHYAVHAGFPGLDEPVHAGELDLAPGQHLVLRCTSGFDRCQPEPNP